MLTYKQIAKAVTDMLLAKFPTIEVQASHVEEGFSRPSFFVLLDDLNRKSYKYCSIRSMTIIIYFFPTDRYNFSLEVLDMQQQLEELFNLNLNVGDRVIQIANTDSQLVDKVLEFSIDIEYLEEPLPDGVPQPPLMQELDYNG